MNQLSFTRHVPALGPGAVQRFTAPVGSTLADLAAMVEPATFGPDGRRWDGPILAYVQSGPGQWIPAPLGEWGDFRPGALDVVRFYARPAGGSSGQILALAGTVLLTALAPGIGTAFATSALGFGAAVAGTAGFAALSFAVSTGVVIGGSYLLGRLFAAESPANAFLGSSADATVKTIENISADFNPFGRDTYPPRVFGQRRISPPDLMQPWPTIETGAPAVTKLMGAAGPHAISAIKANGALIDGDAAFTSQTRDGAANTPITTFVTGFAKTTEVGEEMANFSLSGAALEDQETPANSTPVVLRFTTREVIGFKEISIRLALSQFIKSDGSTAIRFPLRIRFRPEGGDENDWINFPETHWIGSEAGAVLKEIRIRRDNEFGDDDQDGAFSASFWQNVPPVTAWTLADGNSGDQWQAHSHFVFSSGFQDVQNIALRRYGIRVTMTKGLMPDGDYEWEISRGIVTDSTALNSSYQIGGNVVSLFSAYSSGGTWQVPAAQSAYPCRLAVQLASAISSEPPVQKPKTALLAVKAVGRSLKNVSAVFSGKAKDWDGSGFNTWVETSNPALQTRQLLEDLIIYSKVADHSRFSRIAALGESLLVDTDWTGWKAQCNVMGASCSLVSAGDNLGDVLQRLLASGLARMAFGPKLRIDYFRDRSAETPSITFSPRNASIDILYESPRRPMGLRAKYRNKSRDWQEDEIEVRAPISGSTGNWLSNELKAIDDPEWAEARLTFDQLRSWYWRTQYRISSSFEGIACRPGTMVGIVTELYDDTAHGARVLEVKDAQTLRIDQLIPAQEVEAAFTDDVAFADLFEAGEQSTVLLTTPNGAELRTIVDAYEESGTTVIVVDSAFTSTDLLGVHLSIGSLENRIRRCIVVDPQPGEEFSSTLICADEAPEIYAYMKNKYRWAS